MVYNSYGKRPLWQWIVIYIIVGGAVYALIYYFFFARQGGYYSKPAPVTETPETAAEPVAGLSPETVGENEFYLQISANPTLGEYLTSKDGITLYVSSDDGKGVSRCVGSCAVSWPPYVVSSADLLKAEEKISGQIDAIQRDDGSLQVTYKGMPLYLWKGDRAQGDATGHCIGSFSVAKP